MKNSISVKDDASKEALHTDLIEQYKVIVGSLEKDETTRESSNQFWIMVNSAGLSILSYMHNSDKIYSFYEKYLAIGLLLFGFFLCLIWLSVLNTVRQKITIKRKILVDIEEHLPLKALSSLFYESSTKLGRLSVTFREMMAPFLFLCGYGSWALISFFYR